MNEYLIQETTLSSLADEIRVLSGTEDTLTPSQMTSNVQSANDEVDAQSALIDQLSAALEGKVGGGADSSGSVETCTVTIQSTTTHYFDNICYTDGEMAYHSGVTCIVGRSESFNVATNTMMCFKDRVANSSTSAAVQITGNFEYPSGTNRVILIKGDTSITFAATCFVKGTLITLYDGNQKEVQDISYSDELFVWDFDNGCYASAKPLWIKKAEANSYYYRCTFENGIVLKLVGSDGKCHRVFSLDDNRFESATDCVGKMVMTEKGATKLLSCERVDEPVEYYNIITDYHMNLFANNVLTSCRLNNLYLIEDMKFVKEERNVISIEQYDGIDNVFYNGLRLSERKAEDIDMLNEYVNRLYARME